jgi:hypothetical protein
MRFTDRVSRVFSEPRLVARGLNRIYHRRGGLRAYNTAGVDVFKEDWDTLVVLDACRYDMFKSTSQLEGTLSSHISKGSSTVEWLQANFDGRDLCDTVYVTANPQLERNRNRWNINLHKIINVWLKNGWDEETGTVRAGTMTKTALKATEQYPQKRLVIHYMQPHYPFVPSKTDFDKKHLQQIHSEDDSPMGENVWSQKFNGTLHVSQEELWSMYVENLEYVLEHIEKLLANISGKTVVTGDHGNYVGERASPVPIQEYGHPRGLYDEPVVRVPWLEYTNGNRREITKELGSQSNKDIQSSLVTERLEKLGYT